MPTLTFLLDVDNTLLDNDAVKNDYDIHLQSELGSELTKHFWELYEEVRHEKNVIDIPLTITRLREQTPLSELDERTYEHIRSIFDNYPFEKALYPQAIETLQYLGKLGTTVIVSDGDPIFQAEKIVNSHLADTVGGRVLLFIHKQQNIADIEQQYPSDHYVMIDDKPQILADMKAGMGNRVTTVFVQQGKYAQDPMPEHFQPDFSVAHIADVQHYTAEQFLHGQQSRIQQ